MNGIFYASFGFSTLRVNHMLGLFCLLVARYSFDFNRLMLSSSISRLDLLLQQFLGIDRQWARARVHSQPHIEMKATMKEKPFHGPKI